MNVQLFTLGYRCSSAGILKLLGYKKESYPFDWMISRLPIIKDCIETNFEHFLNKENYKEETTQTIHYGETNNVLICNEHIVYNTYYQEKFTKEQVNIPSYLNVPNDTYAHYLALNHRNILKDEDREYFQRCIKRFQILIHDNPHPKMYIYIHPVITIDEYEKNKESLIKQFLDFQNFMASLNKDISMRGLFIIMVRTLFEQPITNHIENITENIYDINDNKKDNKDFCSIYLVYTHKNFMDAGEIFMQQNNEFETSTLIHLVHREINHPKYTCISNG
jgi:hypothetical protein